MPVATATTENEDGTATGAIRAFQSWSEPLFSEEFLGRIRRISFVTSERNPSYCWGVIAPAAGDEMKDTNASEPLLPPEVTTISNVLGIGDYTEEGVADAIERFPACTQELVNQGAQRITLNGMPISVNLGRARVLELIELVQKDFGIPGDTAGEAAVAAMHHLGVRTVTVGSRWDAQINNLLITYLNEAGIEVLSITTRGQWARHAFGMSFELGVRMAFDLGREAARAAPEADAIYLPGGAWRPLPAVPILEEDYGKPVFTNRTTQTWRLIHDGVAPPVQGWGRLLATP